MLTNISSQQTQANVQNKSKALGFWTATSLVISAMLGAGIFGIPASLAAFGSISILAWLATAVGTIFLALTFIELNKMIPETGGAFLYAYHAYGELMGFVIAMSYWFAWCVGCAGALVPIIDFLIPYWPILDGHHAGYSPWLSLGVKCLFLWLTVFINILGIKAVGRVQLITTLLKLIPLLAICIFGIEKIHLHTIISSFNITHESNIHALTGAAALTLFAYLGFEAAVIPADDVTSHRTIAWSTILGTVVTSLLYILTSFILFGLYPAEQLKKCDISF